MKNFKILISNFNTVPSELMSNWSEDWLLLDQSDTSEIVNALRALKDSRVRFVPHVGHNLLDYLNFIVENFTDLPDIMVLAKGNIIPRHIEPEQFYKAMSTGLFSPLYSDSQAKEIKGTQYFPQPNLMVEVNNSWYVNKARHRFFTDFNEFMNFLFTDWKSPDYILFNPGACFIVEAERIRKYPRSFWVCLQHILKYDFFPAEAWMVERALYTIFASNLQLCDYLLDENLALKKLNEIPDQSNVYIPGPGPLRKLKELLHF